MSNPQNAAYIAFSNRLKATANKGGKDLVLSIADAMELSTYITALITRQNELLQELVQAQRDRGNNRPTNFDGGSFKD